MHKASPPSWREQMEQVVFLFVFFCWQVYEEWEESGDIWCQAGTKGNKLKGSMEASGSTGLVQRRQTQGKIEEKIEHLLRKHLFLRDRGVNSED